MCSKYSELLYGQIEDVLYHLNRETCSLDELQAALANAFRMIEQLQKEQRKDKS